MVEEQNEVHLRTKRQAPLSGPFPPHQREAWRESSPAAKSEEREPALYQVQQQPTRLSTHPELLGLDLMLRNGV
jgi:hypothetical protein